MKAYTSHKLGKLRNYVDDQSGHCDDIAFNFVVANATRQPGVMLEDPVVDFPESGQGLYDATSEEAKAHRNKLRSECLKWISDFFQGNQPEPFYVESPDFYLSVTRQKGNPISLANRQYSVMWDSIGQCVSRNGRKPR